MKKYCGGESGNGFTSSGSKKGSIIYVPLADSIHTVLNFLKRKGG